MATLFLPAFVLLCAGLCLSEVISLDSQPRGSITDLSTKVNLRRPHNGYARPVNGIDQELSLLDIVLVASVDGNLHALNRTSGSPLWSMSTPPNVNVPSSLKPLVRTTHPEPDPDDEDTQEVYVIEPQTGEIYIMPNKGSPLQRLPLSMAQLVELSPYSISGEDSMKVFVGKKETSLLLVELETGRVKATVNPNAECLWDPFEDFFKPNQDDDDIDLDELDGSKPSKGSQSTEVFIGRTDYHISIHTRPLNPSIPRPPVQNLSFSTYGPNNQDLALQTLYQRNADDNYIQSLPNGRIMAFKTSFHSDESDITPGAQALWGRAFTNPIVAVFDVVQSRSRAHPFVLLQPQINLQELLPNIDLASAAKQDRLPNLERAFVGMVEETGSLYVMSPDRYPLVVFGDTSSDDTYIGRSIDPPPGVMDFDSERDFPPDVDSIIRAMKREKLKELCKKGSKDKRCLTGVHRLESSRLSRLLDGSATVPYPPGIHIPISSDNNSKGPNVFPPVDNVSIPSAGRPQPVIEAQSGAHALTSAQALSAYAAGVVSLVLLFLWYFPRRGSSLPAARPTPTPTEVKIADFVEAPESTEAAVSKAAPVEPIPAEAPPVEPSQPQSAHARKVSFGDAIKVEPVVNGDADDAGDNGDGDDSDGDQTPATGKRKPMRRRRGKKKKGPTLNGIENDTGEAKEADSDKVGNGHANGPQTPKANGENGVVHVVSPSSIVVPPPATPTPVVPSLVVSDTILGFGSHGTVVFKGSLQGRAVAVKRLLQDFVTLAAREVNILQESDDHPNVIRYYYQEAHANFLYIALELCPATLADVVERPDQFRDIAVAFDPKRALRQITSGVRHLHALKIIHRDIKPQNILISHAKQGVGENAGHRMLISDFGLCKKLEIDQTSFLPTAAAGTVGWRAPEILRGDVRIEESGGEESQSSRGSVGTASDGTTPTGRQTRLTKSVDIFALGCLFYYVLTNGGHPFGERYEREMNIMKNVKSLDGLESFGEEGSEAVDLITRMLCPEAYERPDTSTCLLHPYFWNPGKRLNFLQDASDRFEIMCRDPRDAMLVELERGAFNVVGNDWNARLDKFFIENLGKYRKYDGRSIQDLMRALRNKKHHYQDLPDNVKRQIGSMPEGFLSYFTRRFPRLFLHVHSVVSSSPLRYESMFRTYFELTD